MIKLEFVQDLVPVENFLGLKKSTEYLIVKNNTDIGVLEAYINDSEIYIFHVRLDEEFQKHGYFKKWLKEQNKKVIALWPTVAAKKYWTEVADEIIF